jgi:N-acetylmuramic acid 6-phosphate (MurNAc-6-P) etherase
MEQYSVGNREQANSKQVPSGNRHQQLVDETTNVHESNGRLRNVDARISEDFEQLSQHGEIIYLQTGSSGTKDNYTVGDSTHTMNFGAL